MAELDEDFLRQMEKHKQKELELLQKIALKNGNPSPSMPAASPHITPTSSKPFPSFFNSLSPVPVQEGTGVLYTGSVGSPGIGGVGYPHASPFNDPTYSQPFKKQRTEGGYVVTDHV